MMIRLKLYVFWLSLLGIHPAVVPEFADTEVAYCDGNVWHIKVFKSVNTETASAPQLWHCQNKPGPGGTTVVCCPHYRVLGDSYD